MTNGWDQAKVQQYIDNGIEESLMLEYKAAEALSKSPGKKREITKDVSAMANAAGGLILYGVKEHQQTDKKHLPEHIDPVDRTQFSKEWVEQVISNIRPRMETEIVPVKIASGPEHVVYVVQIPQATTPHQAQDYRYYKRHNFESVPMEDYEINDVRSRIHDFGPHIIFYATLKDANIVYLTVENIGSEPAVDVEFQFFPDLTWKTDEVPLIFSNGIKYMLPKQRHDFFYDTFVEIMSEESIPTSFTVNIDYGNSSGKDRTSEEFSIDFNDYLMSTAIESEMHKHGKILEKSIGQLKEEVKKLNKLMGSFPAVTNSTGLDLSITTLRNLEHLMKGEAVYEKFDPRSSSPGVFKEVLGIDLDLAFQLTNYFRRSEDINKESLMELEGFSEEIYDLLATYFKI